MWHLSTFRLFQPVESDVRLSTRRSADIVRIAASDKATEIGLPAEVGRPEFGDGVDEPFAVVVGPVGGLFDRHDEPTAAPDLGGVEGIHVDGRLPRLSGVLFEDLSRR